MSHLSEIFTQAHQYGSGRSSKPMKISEKYSSAQGLHKNYSRIYRGVNRFGGSGTISPGV